MGLWSELASLVLMAPIMVGAEYLTPEVLRALWAELALAMAAAVAKAGTSPACYWLGTVQDDLVQRKREDSVRRHCEGSILD
jgi:hypothetical protein